MSREEAVALSVREAAMGRIGSTGTGIGLLAVTALAMLSAIVAASPGPAGIPPDSVSFERGARLFSGETFRGNGRTCATCHEPVNEFTISPALVQSRFAQDPNHPLFRPLDSNDGEGKDYSNLLNHALVTVGIPLHAAVSVVGEPLRRTVTVWRGTPSIANIALTAPYQQDGGAATLQAQAFGAIHTHMEPGREPRKHELDSLARFQSELFYPLRIRALLEGDEPTTSAPGFSVPAPSQAAQRGRDLFDANCSRCHALPLGHRPEQASLSIFQRTFVSDANRLSLPVLKLAFLSPDGTVTIVETPDPGRAALSGDPADLNAFEIPMLRGVKHTAPYFHDNSAATLSDVITHYNEFFGFGIRGDDRDDLIAFLELL